MLSSSSQPAVSSFALQLTQAQSIMSNISNAFRTERLVFRAVEDNDEDLDFIVRLSQDPDALSHTDSAIPKPQSRRDAKKWRDEAMLSDKQLLSVFVCLPAESTPAGASTPTGAPASAPAAESAAARPAAASETSNLSVRSLDTAGTWGAISSKPAAPPTKPKPTPIGYVSLDGAWSADYGHHRRSGVLLWMLPEYRGKGYGEETLRWLVDYGFRMANLHRVELCVMGWNLRACRLYERIGFVPEGRERECLWFNGAFHDLFYYGILEQEWPAIKEKWEKKIKEEGGAEEKV